MIVSQAPGRPSTRGDGVLADSGPINSPWPLRLRRLEPRPGPLPARQP